MNASETVDEILATTRYRTLAEATDAVVDAASGMSTGDVSLAEAKQLSGLLSRLVKAHAREPWRTTKPARKDPDISKSTASVTCDGELRIAMEVIDDVTQRLLIAIDGDSGSATVMLRLMQANLVLLEIRNELAMSPEDVDAAVLRAVDNAGWTLDRD